MNTLSAILEDTRARIAQGRRERPLAALEGEARAMPAPRGFAAALLRARTQGRVGLIAEIKRASPSRGRIREAFDPPALARAYAAAGASCLSVLTEPRWFEGSLAHLAAARAACPLPALRKDFMLDAWQMAEARAAGADCVLLIMAALTGAQATELEDAAASYGLDVLLEAHSAAEVEAALRLRSPLVGINNRDLATLRVDRALAPRLAAMVPPGRLVIAESGLRTHADLQASAAAGVTSFLVGEALMAEDDVEAATRALLGAG